MDDCENTNAIAVPMTMLADNPVIAAAAVWNVAKHRSLRISHPAASTARGAGNSAAFSPRTCTRNVINPCHNPIISNSTATGISQPAIDE